MTRPDIEGLRDALIDYTKLDREDALALLDYILALEAARDTVLNPGDGRNSQPFWQSVREEFDRAVARWTP